MKECYYQVPAFQMLGIAIHQVNHYPMDKYLGKPILLCYPLDGDFFT